MLFLVSSLFLTLATTARAQETPAQSSAADPYAEDLFAAGTKLLEEKRFGEALVKLEAAQKMDPGLGTEFNIAVCYEELGKLASALRMFTQVADGARAAGKTQREHAARARIEGLASRVPAIEIQPANVADAKELIVRVDGVILDSSHWALWPLDPGDHIVEAAAPAKKSWSTTIATPPEGAHATVIIPILEVALAPNGAPPVEDTKRSRRTLAYIFGGVGALGVVASTVTGIMFLDARSIVKDRCNGGPSQKQCIDGQGNFDARGADAQQRGHTLAPLNAIAWGVSAIGLGVGTYFFLSSRAADRPKSTGFVLAPTASSSGGGLLVRGDLPL